MPGEKVTLKEEKIATDILVIGAGAGGLMAAITAADSGANVILCEKGNARRSGGIAGGNDHFWVYVPGFHSEQFRSNFIKQQLSGGFKDEDRVTLFIDKSYEVLKLWESFGVDMKHNGAYEFAGHGWPGDKQTDLLQLHFSDQDLCAKLEKKARQKGARIMNRVMITELLQDDSGRVVGAVGISTREPTLYVFQAKSVVVNKGGVSYTRLYPTTNLIGFNGAEPGTGDGVMIAYRAGASLHDAELAGRQCSLRFNALNGKGTWIGVARDAEGKPIAPPYLEKPDRLLGEAAVGNAAAIQHAWEAGKGPVWMDPRGISKEEEQYMRWGFQSEGMQAFLAWADREKIDLSSTRFEFREQQIGSNIQARVDVNGRTCVAGLLFIPPGSLSESAVYGMTTAVTAAEDIKEAKTPDVTGQQGKTQEAKRGYEDLLNREGPQYADWHEAQWAIWQIMYCYANPPHRTENTLRAGYNQLLRLRDLARKTLRASNPHELYHCLEVLNLMDVAELVLLAVMERKESRGQSIRQDYPFVNPMLNKYLLITNRDGKPSFSWEKPRRIS